MCICFISVLNTTVGKACPFGCRLAIWHNCCASCGDKGNTLYIQCLDQVWRQFVCSQYLFGMPSLTLSFIHNASSLQIQCWSSRKLFNTLNTELNPIRHLLALVGARHIVHVRRIRVNLLDARIDEFREYVHVQQRVRFVL